MKFIFEVRIKKGHTAEEYAAAWVSASELIQQAPGARGTRLHRSLDDPNRLIAIAEWDSKAQRDAMEKRTTPKLPKSFVARRPLWKLIPLASLMIRNGWYCLRCISTKTPPSKSQQAYWIDSILKAWLPPQHTSAIEV